MIRKLLLMLLLASAGVGLTAQPHHGKEPDAALKSKAEGWLKNDQTGFVENKGQIKDQNNKPNPSVKYLLNMQGLNVQLRAGGFSYDAWVQEKTGKKFTPQGSDAPVDEIVKKFHRVDIALEGANMNAPLVAVQPVSGSMTNVIGATNFTGIRQWGKVTYQDIYPGIDLEFVARKGTEKPVEYNFIVHPGADASQIKMHYESGSDIALKDGKINMKLAFGTLEEKIPLSFTKQDGKSLAVQYKALDEQADLYAFNVPDYDKQQTLVIDPTPNLVWATYFGGNAVDVLISADVDDNGNVFVTGYAISAGMGTAGTYQSTYTNTTGPSNSGLVVKFTSAGARLWSTYYNGFWTSPSSLGNIQLLSVKVDPTNAYVYTGGYLISGPLAITPNGFQTAPSTLDEAVLLKLDAVTGNRKWDTYYGSAGADRFYAIEVASDGSVYAAGSTTSPTNGAIATGSAQQSGFGGATDAMLVKFDSLGARKWGTYYGGALSDIAYTVSVDKNDNPYIAGVTSSTTAIAASTTQGTTLSGSGDGFIARFDPVNGMRTWGRYYGGTGGTVGTSLTGEYISNITVDMVNSYLYVTGKTSIGDIFLNTTGVSQTTYGGSGDGFIGKLDLNGISQWGSFIGGTGAEVGNGVKLDTGGNIYIGGNTTSATDISTSCSSQPVIAGSTDGFITKFLPNGTKVWGTYFGGPVFESISNGCLAIDKTNNIYLAGYTNSNTGITTAGSFQPAYVDFNDAFLAKFKSEYLPSDFTLSANTIDPLTQSACKLGIPKVITGTSIGITNKDPGYKSPLVYQWQASNASTGPWADIIGETSKDLQPPAASITQYYRRLGKVNTDYCNYQSIPGSESAVAAVIVPTGANTAPIANANGPLWYLCGPSGAITLSGSVKCNYLAL